MIFYSPKWKVFQDDRCEIHAFRDGCGDGSWITKTMYLEKNAPNQLLLELQKQGVQIAILPKASPFEKLLENPDYRLKPIHSGTTHTIWLLPKQS